MGQVIKSVFHITWPGSLLQFVGSLLPLPSLQNVGKCQITKISCHSTLFFSSAKIRCIIASARILQNRNSQLPQREVKSLLIILIGSTFIASSKRWYISPSISWQQLQRIKKQKETKKEPCQNCASVLDVVEANDT